MPSTERRCQCWTGPGDKKTTAEGGSEYPGDTSRGALQPSSQVADVETGRESVFTLSLLSH